MAFRKDSTISSNFSKITISLASPESILERSSGEVLKPETINYRTYKPERDGLFCERIFGPVKDWECHCGKYKRIRYKGIICDRCGVEVTEKKVRRERMGHIQLVVPVAHIWYFRSLPNKIGALLGLQTKKLDMIIYYERYVVIQSGIKEADGINYMDFLTEEEYIDIAESLPADNQHLPDTDPNKFIAKMGAEAISDLLARLDLDQMSFELRHKANTETSQQRKQEALKRLQVFEAFRDARTRIENRPEWMIVKVVPVIPPELRPLVPLDGGRFATSDLNDLYRRVIIRNNRLKRLIEIKAPDVIMRNEKRMLQEAVDSLFDNSRKASAVKTESNRPLKSLSDSLKGKQGRFRQNLLGKRVDYSGRSVIVVGPELNLNECGIPKDMASELFKPFIIRKMLERGIVKTVKSAKKIVDRKDPVVWDILENILKGHPIMLNRAPTLHRLGIQAFQPKLVEGKAIQLHPLVCTAFNADFDGDQMAVHLPLGNAAILEAQVLMLASHNILNPANGAPITVPSQDMVLGLYYITKARKSTPEHIVKGEGRRFYGPEEVIIAYNEKNVDLHANINVAVNVRENKVLVSKIIETTVGRVLFNEVVPEGFGFINQLLTKKSLRDIIGEMVKMLGTAAAAKFLDDIKNLGFQMAYKGGLSFNLGNVKIPAAKEELINQANVEVEEVLSNYNMGFITNNERYNQIIDIWTHTNSKLTNTVMQMLINDDQGFNPVYMMLDSGARGSKEQIRQLSGMRGLMAKPQKSGATGGEIIENPILSNFKEGLTVLEYFISTHGARKGLADTALKTADAGYLTRRLVDVSQDVVITEKDCGTLRGLTISALKKSEEIVESLFDRILGRVALHDIYHPQSGELIIAGGEEITEDVADVIGSSPIENVEIRSVLTCESKQGVCANCYGRNLASGKLVQKGEAVGVIAAQSIGEPGTQLTLRTFHVGGTASNIAIMSKIEAKYDGVIEIDELRFVETVKDDKTYDVVIGRSAEMKIIDKKTGIILTSGNIPYGANLYVKNGSIIKKGDQISDWDPYNAVILSEYEGKIGFENIIEGITYRVESDEQTGYNEKVIIENRLKTKNPVIKILDKDNVLIKTYDIPVGAHVVVEEGDKVKAGGMLVKIPRAIGKSGDITGGLPRVTELFEARNPSEPAIVSEIDGVVSFGKKLKRGNREIIVTSKTGEEKSYLVPTSKQILAQENDFVKAGTPLSEGAMTPADILAIKGPMKVQEYIVNEVQEVYRLQGVKINDKHFEVIVRQMMRKVEVEDPGDTRFLEGELINKIDFQEENDEIFGKKVVTDPGDSDTLRQGQIITARKMRDENSLLKRKDKKLVEARDAKPATAFQKLQGITRASLQTNSFISAASFQETTKVLTMAAINAKSDELKGLKENVIVGHKIPAGTGLLDYDDLIVGSKAEYEAVMETASRSLKVGSEKYK
ncbi:MAG: DNA-directed RNA polymerase subunit beta' [Bacteroidetes bacterium HGW-Bacteroidetes-1]|jgi:DNA-directed RNA polymerase subunit beta'|nr:MAG: DNA-directed RNA polymerase subunit beta' [Bacteroidetes bacterium HGW-Bacteroidetes-1]